MSGCDKPIQYVNYKTSAPVYIPALLETFTDQGVLNQVVLHVKDYDGHWKGEAFLTFHSYGEQVHRTREDAERWNAGQAEPRFDLWCNIAGRWQEITTFMTVAQCNEKRRQLKDCVEGEHFRFESNWSND